MPESIFPLSAVDESIPTKQLAKPLGHHLTNIAYILIICLIKYAIGEHLADL
jgi:hypothetical protein